MSLSAFDVKVGCEEFYTTDHTNVDEDMDVLYIDPRDGKVKAKPEPPSAGRINGIEL